MYYVGTDLWAMHCHGAGIQLLVFHISGWCLHTVYILDIYLYVQCRKCAVCFDRVIFKGLVSNFEMGIHLKCLRLSQTGLSNSWLQHFNSLITSCLGWLNKLMHTHFWIFGFIFKNLISIAEVHSNIAMHTQLFAVWHVIGT